MNTATQVLIDHLKSFFEASSFIEQSKNSQRIFHGRGGGFDQLNWCCIDYFDPVILITCFEQPPEQLIENVTDYIQTQSSNTCIIKQSRYLPRSPFEVIAGQLPEQVVARRGSLSFLLNFQQQNIGFFLDMEPGREWLEARAAQKTVLNLFAYTCAFSVIARESGAKRVVNVDLSRRALTTGRENHRLNNHDLTGIQFEGIDILKSWGRLKKNGPYDLIIVDPPSYQKGSFVATRDYVKIIRRLDELSALQAEVLLCLNDPSLPPEFILDLVEQHAPSLQFNSRLPQHPHFPDASTDAALKLLTFRRH